MRRKEKGVATVLAAVFGLLGILGIGHFYVERIRRGIGFLFLGIVLAMILAMLIAMGLGSPGGFYLLAIGIGLLAVVDLAVWVWQVYDAYRLAAEYNYHLREFREPPW